MGYSLSTWVWAVPNPGLGITGEGNVRIVVWDVVVKTDFQPINIRKFDPVDPIKSMNLVGTMSLFLQNIVGISLNLKSASQLDYIKQGHPEAIQLCSGPRKF